MNQTTNLNHQILT